MSFFISRSNFEIFHVQPHRKNLTSMKGRNKISYNLFKGDKLIISYIDKIQYLKRCALISVYHKYIYTYIRISNQLFILYVIIIFYRVYVRDKHLVAFINISVNEFSKYILRHT